MLQLWVEEGREGLFGRLAREMAPDGRAAIGLLGERSQGIAGLERKVLLDGMDWGEVVVFDLAQLEKAASLC